MVVTALTQAAYQPTHAEATAYAEMQARLVSLLLRYEEELFPRYYGKRSQSEGQHSDWAQPYRDLAAFYLLRDELFDHILPRIVRRLSFESPRSTEVEEPPARGRIDWSRTLDATWSERPGEPPLELVTRHRRRTFATPENLLVVATLVEYRHDALRLLQDDRIARGEEAQSHPLVGIAQRCERELTFPQFAGLRHTAERLVITGSEGIEDLERQVHERAIPGSNSAYQELIAWRKRRRELALLERNSPPQGETLGADPARDNYLYQLWIFYELADLLNELGCMKASDVSLRPMRLHFRWKGCAYELRHDQAVPLPIGSWRTEPDQAHRVPGIRPDFYLWRIDPAPYEVRAEKLLIWREPGVVWDAKYYRERDTADAPAPPIKRMIADLALLGETHGTLLFAFLKGQSNPEQGYHIQPAAPRDQTLTPTQVSIQQLRPGLPGITSSVRDQLLALIGGAHAQLSSPRIPACHGVFLDALSAQDGTALTDRWGAALDSTANDLLLCSKPHIGPWRVDLVSRARHCCNDARLCHIVGQAGARPPIRPPRTAEELLAELAQLTDAAIMEGDLGERASQIAQQIERLTRRLATEMGVFRRIEVYYHRVRDMGLRDLFDQLGVVERESLALAVFLVEQLDTIGAKDFSAPAIHLSSVVEVSIQQRVFACPNLVGDLALHKKQTLGVLPYLRQNPEGWDGNWPRILAYVDAHWDAQIDPDDPDLRVTFDALISRGINRIAQIRNMAAHPKPVSRHDYTDLQTLIFQGGKLPCGVLKALLLAWKT